MIVSAPAKINLNLHVTGQRADGYHSLESLVAFASVGDEVSVELATQDSLTFSGPFREHLQADPATNLVLKARDALRQSVFGLSSVAIHLTKNLPLSSGIGGGSADAAATLHALNSLYRLGLSLETLCNIAKPLGADVPMCLHGRPLIAKGIGEIIEPVDLPEFFILLVNPSVAVSTPAIFKALAKKENAALPALPHFAAHKSPAAISSLLTYLHATRNDLQPPALSLQPIIGEVIAVLAANGAAFSRMSGSGATCFGIFENLATLEAAKTVVSREYPHWWVG